MAKALSESVRGELPQPYGFCGSYKITGTVTELGIVGSYIVKLFDRKTGRVIRKTLSRSSDGYYEFLNLHHQINGYFAVAFDHGDNPLNAAIADLITPEPML